jgi:predicted chitinase
MRAHEFDKDFLNEDLKNNLKIGAMGGLLALGSYVGMKQPTSKEHITNPEIIYQHTNKTTVSQTYINKMKHALATPLGKSLYSVATSAGMEGNELAQFIAQCAHETAFFTTMKENGGSLDFRKYDIKFNPTKAKQLGNVDPGDGNKYHGRGFIQLTGRDNYKKAGHALNLPLEKHPELVEQPKVAAKVALWFWTKHVKPKVHNFNDTRTVTKPINSGLHQLKDRDEAFKATKHILSQNG